MYIYLYIYIFWFRNFKYFVSLQEILKILAEVILVDQVILTISPNQFFLLFFFNQNP